MSCILLTRRSLSVLALLAAFATAGCGESGPALSSVSGKVTKAGKPLANINVTFTPAAGGPASAGRTDADGRFALICQNGKAGAVPGKHKVVLQTVQEAAVDSNSDPKAAMEAYMKMRGGSGKKNTAPSNDPSGGAFPKEYSDASKTPLQYEVGTSGNEFDIVIPSPEYSAVVGDYLKYIEGKRDEKMKQLQKDDTESV